MRILIQGWPMVVASFLAIALTTVCSLAVLADEPGIKDNSFFVEEAYNQDQGIVQNIFNWIPTWDHPPGVRTRDFNFLFTQEWPIGDEMNQFSYTIPLSSHFEQPDGGISSNFGGLGDILLNYRYQLFKEKEDGVAVAPRFSVILPSGDKNKGLGTGETGFQTNWAFSKEMGETAFHFNAGLTAIPNVSAPGMSPAFDLVSYNLGFSMIDIESKTFQPLVEFLALWNSNLNDTGTGVQRDFELIISPGFRWSIYQEEETQVVIGAAVPVGLTRSAPDIGAFFYLSIEAPCGLLKQKCKECQENN